MSYRCILLALLALIPAGCQTAPPSQSSPYYRIPTGSLVTVHESLPVPTGSSRVYLQGGKVVDVNAVSRFYPSCSFKVMGPLDAKRAIEAGVFEVSGFSQFRRPFGLDADGRGIQVASMAWGGMFDRGREIVYITVMNLKSPQQTDVHDLTCKVTSDPLGTFVTLEEIRQALGPVASFEIQGT
ncbi:MAG: hypothetical protein U9R74_07770 [Pseudomonadota bacterium]|nr:hypothetical protein [Pseudomonadota bacterium]